MGNESAHTPIADKVVEKKNRKLRLTVLRTAVVRTLFFGLLLALWQLICSTGLWNELLFPSPVQVLETLLAGFRDGSLPAAISASLKRLVLGYGIAVAVGVPVGLAIGRYYLAENTIGVLVLGLQSLPSICWLPLAILWFGLNETAMQFVIIMGSLMALILSVRDGVKTIPPMYLRAARVLGAHRWKYYLHVVLPASLPSIITGAKLGWTFAWRSLMAAELLYVSIGLGTTLTIGRELHDMALVIAAMFIIIALGILIDRLVFGLLEKFVSRRWGFSPVHPR